MGGRRECIQVSVVRTPAIEARAELGGRSGGLTPWTSITSTPSSEHSEASSSTAYAEEDSTTGPDEDKADSDGRLDRPVAQERERRGGQLGSVANVGARDDSLGRRPRDKRSSVREGECTRYERGGDEQGGERGHHREGEGEGEEGEGRGRARCG